MMFVLSHRLLVLVLTLGFTLPFGYSADKEKNGKPDSGKKPAAKEDKNTEGLKEYLTKTTEETEKLIAEYSKLPKKPIEFGANLTLAHGANIKGVSEETLLACADGLKEVGVRRVEINPIVTAHADAEVARKYKSLVEHLRKLGVKLALNPESWDKKASGIDSFAQYEKAAMKQFAEWAGEFKPDYFVLVHEPTTMSARLGVETTPKQWRSFIEATAKVVKRASPKSRIGAGCFAGSSDREVPFYEEFAKIHDVEFLTMDNYFSSPGAIKRIELMTKIAHDAKKPVYMEETWRPHFLPKGFEHTPGKSLESESGLGFGYVGFEPLDEKWLHAMALFAATHGLESMTAFQSQCLFLYVDARQSAGPEFKKEVQQAILHKKRSKNFEAYRKLIHEFGKGGEKK